MPTYDSIAGLPLEIDEYELERRELDVSSGFTRVTTVARMRGGREEGAGEDVTYAAPEHDRLQSLAAGSLELAGRWSSFDEWSQHVSGLDLFPLGEPENEVYRSYRRWGFESAALDLALRQAGLALADVLGREPRPVRFVVSMRLGDAPTTERLRQWLELYPGLMFKLDATSAWHAVLVDELRELGCVDSIDLKAQYRGTSVDQPPDARLYRLVAEGFPGAWIEDPDVNHPETRAVLEPHRDRITWDAIIHSVEDIEALPWAPKMLNVKPSRFGSVRALFEAYDYCDARGIDMYGGGQFELGPGRGQIQYLASLFHPDGPNDVAPGGFNENVPRPGLLSSPLEPQPSRVGFQWGAGA
jgi:hypothetical protein